MENEKIKAKLAENIQFYRKQKQMTQLELAEFLSYSDKAVSKWERGEGVPDIYVLEQLSSLFEVSIDDLIKSKPKIIVPKTVRNKKHLTITLSAFVLVWVAAITSYSVLEMLNVDAFNLWHIFIISIPIAAIVLLVFASMWGSRLLIFITISLFIWSLALSLTLLVPVSKSFLFFIIAAPIQIVIIFISFSVKYSILKNHS
ncbi:MAG: helix-turn-helix transcriptional regulator [Acholeplasmataceae bacterium]